MEAGERRKIPVWLSALPFMVAVGSLAAALLFLKAPIYLALLVGWMTAYMISRSYGLDGKQLVRASYDGMKGTFLVVSILILIGGVIAVWMASGTVAGVISFGIEWVRPQYLVVTAFLLTFGMSMLLGTSVGTLSTMGIALAGMAQVYNIPANLIGGALISGAMVGDRSSPLSGTLHLVAATTETKVEDVLPRIMRSALPTFLLCLLIFSWLGFKQVDIPNSLQSGMQEVENMRQAFRLHWIVLLPPVLVLLFAFLRMPIRSNLLLGTLLGGILAWWLQERSVQEILSILWNGAAILGADGREVLHGGGIWKMLNVVLIILSAGALNGILEASGMMQNLIGGLLDRIHQEKSLILATMLTSVSTGFVFCNQALMVIIPGRMLKGKYEELGINRLKLASTLADSGVVTSALIPWNLHGILCSTAMGISTSTYWPYAFFLWGLPLLTVIKTALKKSSKKNVQSLTIR